LNDELTYTQKDLTGLITFNRPHARNALTFEMYESLAAICQQLIDGELNLRCLILTGAGDLAFAAGTDISCFRDFSRAEQALEYERSMDRVLGLLESVPIPVIAAIRGACTGGGAAIAACCDIRIASDDLRYGFPIARTLGNCLSADNLSRIVDLLGAARAKEILLTSRLIHAQEAQQIYLINETAEDPLTRAYELAEQLAVQAPLTIAASKEGLRRLRAASAEVASDDLIVQCYTSADFRVQYRLPTDQTHRNNQYASPCFSRGYLC